MRELSQGYCQMIYRTEGIDGFEKLGFGDEEILELLGRKVMARECILPALKKAGWPLERMIAAERKFGVDEESIDLFSRQYSVLDSRDYSKMSLMEMARYISENS